MLNQFSRTELLFGKEAMERLADSRVAVCAVDSELGAVQPIAEIGELLPGYPNCRFRVGLRRKERYE